MPRKKYTEITSKLIESYRNDLYEENVYLIKETIYKDGSIRDLKNEQSPYKEDATLKDFFDRKYVTAEELEAHLNHCFPDYQISVNRALCNYCLYDIKIIWYKNGKLMTKEVYVDYTYVINRENWKCVRKMVREHIEGGLL